MLAGAIWQYLKAQGLSPVYVAQFGDYTQNTAYAVRTDRRRVATLNDGSYNAGVQLRTRASNPIAAENAGRAALALVLAADGSTLAWDDPTGPAGDRSYLVEAIEHVNGPTWYPTAEAGEECSLNLSLLVTEV